MLNIYSVNNKVRTEIFPSNGIYNVHETLHYEIIYQGDIKLNNIVFIEDIPIISTDIRMEDNRIVLSENSYFQNYFGIAVLKINDEIFHFNIKIKKLKLSEIEDLFLFLWEKEKNLFNIFLSKSTQKLDFKENGLEIGETSKFLSFVSDFSQTFEKLYFSFKNSPHLCLERKKKLLNYNESKLSSDSITWLASNLDNVEIDLLLKNHPDSFALNQTYGIVEKIECEVNINSTSTYENEIILGSFILILKKIKSFKNEIKSNVNLNLKPDTKYADFKDLKKIPYRKLFDDAADLEKNIKKLYIKYRSIFTEVNPRIEKIRLTPVFAKKNHYKKAYSIIKNLSKYKFELYGEHDLLNITKLSTLYEVYNLYQIVEIINSKLNTSYFNIQTSTTREDGILNKFEFIGKDYSVRIFYENKYGENMNSTTDLIRIDTNTGTYYHPDFIIEFINKNEKSYVILDAKYSKYEIVRSHYLNKCIYKYMLNTGVRNNAYKKIDSLALLYPLGKSCNYLESEFYKPTLDLIVSKPKSETRLNEYLDEIMNEYLPIMLRKNESNLLT